MFILISCLFSLQSSRLRHYVTSWKVAGSIPNYFSGFVNLPNFPAVWPWGSSVGIATGYRVEDGGVGVRVQVGQEFSLFHVVQTGSVVHPASYTMGTGGSLLGGKAAGA
jgi:hypothetical protein